MASPSRSRSSEKPQAPSTKRQASSFKPKGSRIWSWFGHICDIKISGAAPRWPPRAAPQKGHMKVKELIKKLNKHNLDKDVVVYSNEKTLKNYEFLGTYENEGQVEIHIDEGINLG